MCSIEHMRLALTLRNILQRLIPMCCVMDEELSIVFLNCN